MFGSLNTYHFARISSFADAEKHFEETKEIRNQNKFEVGVPVRGDRKQWRNYSIHALCGGDAYSARLYETDVFIWRRDGSIDVNTKYASNLTAAFANYFAHCSGLPMSFASDGMQFGCRLSSLCDEHRDRYLFENAESDRKSWLNFALPKHGTAKFTKRPDGWHFNYTPAYKEYLKKSEGYDVRSQFTALFNYLKIFEMYPMTGFEQVLAEKNTAEYAYGNGTAMFRDKIARDVAKAPDNEELWPVLAAAFHGYNGHYDHANGGWVKELAMVPMKEIKDAVYSVAYSINDTHTTRKLPFGVIRAGWKR